MSQEVQTYYCFVKCLTMVFHIKIVLIPVYKKYGSLKNISIKNSLLFYNIRRCKGNIYNTVPDGKSWEISRTDLTTDSISSCPVKNTRMSSLKYTS